MTITLFLGCQREENKNKLVSGGNSEIQVVQENNPQELVSLRIWGAEEDAQLLDELIEGFKKHYASEAQFDIAVEYHSESACKNDLFDNIKNMPDVFTFADDQLMPMVAAGVLSPIKQAEEVKSSNITAAWESASVNDTLYAYPMTADNGYFLYYNKAYLNEEAIQSMDQMLQIAALNDKKISMDWTSGWYLYAFFGETGLTLGINDDGVSNHCNWNATDTNIKGVDVAQGMLEIAKNPGFLNCTDDVFLSGIQDGSIIAGVSGTWNATTVEAVWGEHYGAAKLPTYTAKNQQVQMGSFAGYKMVGVSDYSKQVEWAHKLAQWITNEQSQILRFNQRGQGPSNINAAATPEIAKSEAIQAILRQSEFSSLQRIAGTFWAPTQAFGEVMAAGNPKNIDLQALLDQMTEGITLSYSYGG